MLEAYDALLCGLTRASARHASTHDALQRSPALISAELQRIIIEVSVIAYQGDSALDSLLGRAIVDHRASGEFSAEEGEEWRQLCELLKRSARSIDLSPLASLQCESTHESTLTSLSISSDEQLTPIAQPPLICERASIPDVYVYRALINLLIIRDARIPYQEVGVEVIGMIYESLLDVTLTREPDGALRRDETQARRATGSHYTPRALAEPLVRWALRPHLERLTARSPGDRVNAILALRVCDPAMGSGALLVECARQLSEALLSARRDVIDDISEMSSSDLHLQARRDVVSMCLYGVDLNPHAVRVARLSLWLFAEVKEHTRPEEVCQRLNHTLRCGDALMSVSASQLSDLLYDDEAPPHIPTPHHPSQPELITIADALLAGALSESGVRSRRRRDRELKARVRTWLKLASSEGSVSCELSDAWAQVEELAGEISTALPERSSCHWELIFPELYDIADAGIEPMRLFDCVIGNPPFIGGRLVSARLGRSYLDWLMSSFEGGRRAADLCAYFTRLGFQLLKLRGTLGLITTASISSGTTQRAGLQWICAHGGVIYRADRRLRWPGPNTLIKVSVIHLTRDEEVSAPALKLLDGIKASMIDSALNAVTVSSPARPTRQSRAPSGTSSESSDTQHPRVPDPVKLTQNRQIASQGSITLGMGFTFDDRSRRALPLSAMREAIKARPSSRELILPYLGGHELNTHPTHDHHRYVIQFGSMNLEEASRWPELLALLKDAVYEARTQHRNPTIRAYPWWLHWNRREGLYKRIERCSRVLLTNAQATAHLCFSFYEARAVFANSINVITLSDWASFARLQSRIHEVWARAHSTRLGDQLRYNPTTCFETYPRPLASPAREEALNQIGERYHTFRAQLMSDAETRHELMGALAIEGLTATYNKFHDASCELIGIVELRSLHRALDRAVADALGWDDLQLEYTWIDEFSGRALEMEPELNLTDSDDRREVRPRLCFTPEVRGDVLRRLLALNQELAHQEMTS